MKAWPTKDDKSVGVFKDIHYNKITREDNVADKRGHINKNTFRPSNTPIGKLKCHGGLGEGADIP